VNENEMAMNNAIVLAQTGRAARLLLVPETKRSSQIFIATPIEKRE